MIKIAAGWQKVIVIQDSVTYFVNSRPSQHAVLGPLSAQQRNTIQSRFNRYRSASICLLGSVLTIYGVGGIRLTVDFNLLVGFIND